MASFAGYEKKLSSRTAMSFSWGNTCSGWRSGRSANSQQLKVERAKTGVLVDLTSDSCLRLVPRPAWSGTTPLLMGHGYAMLLDFLFNKGTSLVDIFIHDSWQLHLHSHHKIVLGLLQFIVNAGSALVKRVHLLLQFLGVGQGRPQHLLLKQQPQTSQLVAVAGKLRRHIETRQAG